MGAHATADELLDGLTDAQREAVAHVEGPLLVVAGAGSGKTRVVTRRVAWLAARGFTAPERVLAITFTNKAAGEMRGRIGRLTGFEPRWTSTFHSACARILRREPDALAAVGLEPGWTIYDRDDSLRLVRELLKEHKVDPKHLPPARVLEAISGARNRMETPEQFAEQASSWLERQVEPLFGAYLERLRARNALDFDDLLAETVAMFEREPAVLADWRRRFDFVLIDEYQDTNPPQDRLARLLAGDGGNLHATGDPDQSIYTWRGADLDNILQFAERNPGCRTVLLEDNFRSTPQILHCADLLIAHNTDRIERGLRTDNPDGEPVEVWRLHDEDDEARTIARWVADAAAEGIADWKDVAVFHRTAAQSRALEASLRDRGIPYQIIGGTEFYQRREVKDLVAYLVVLENPRDDGALLRIINTPPRGIGTRTVDTLTAHAAAEHLTLREAVARAAAGAGPDLATRARNAVAAFDELLTEMAALPRTPVADLVHEVGVRSGLVRRLQDLEEPDRIEKREELANAAAEYDRVAADDPLTDGDGDLGGFLERVSLISDQDSWDPGLGAVSLMTLHAAKGLEFPVVFLAGFEDGLLPHARNRDDPSGMEEERRLAYVGMTRAQQRLVLTLTARRRIMGQWGPASPSPFLRELPLDEVRTDDRADSWVPPLTGEDPDDTDIWDGAPEPEMYEAPGDLREGTFVRHPEFGLGKIMSMMGHGPSARAVVHFQDHGRKELVLEYADLQVVEPWEFD